MMEHVLLGLLSCSLMVVQPASSFPHPSLQLALKCQAISEYFDSVTGSCEPCREICELAHITRTQQECETQCGGECHGELFSSQLSTCLSHHQRDKSSYSSLTFKPVLWSSLVYHNWENVYQISVLAGRLVRCICSLFDLFLRTSLLL